MARAILLDRPPRRAAGLVAHEQDIGTVIPDQGLLDSVCPETVLFSSRPETAPTIIHAKSVNCGSGLWRDADNVRLGQRVGEIVGAETRVDYEPERGRGRTLFTFHSLEALEGILERLGYDEN